MNGFIGCSGRSAHSELTPIYSCVDPMANAPNPLGLAIGLAIALGSNSLTASLLFEIEPTDLATLSAVTVTMALVAALACWLPAWRASRLRTSSSGVTDMRTLREWVQRLLGALGMTRGDSTWRSCCHVCASCGTGRWAR